MRRAFLKSVEWAPKYDMPSRGPSWLVTYTFDDAGPEEQPTEQIIQGSATGEDAVEWLRWWMEKLGVELVSPEEGSAQN